MHGSVSTSTVTGRATVVRGGGLLARAVATLFGFPPSAEDVELKVTFRRAGGVETWQREFGAHHFVSVQFAGAGRYEGLLCERFGPFTFGIALVVDGRELRLVVRRWSLLGIPLPRGLAPRVDSFETEAQRRFELKVAIALPLIGDLVHYTGWLDPTSTPTPGDSSPTYLD
jgi:hypothetical protein